MNEFSLALGVGGKYFITKNVVLRADLRGFCTIVDGEGAFISHGGATVVHFTGSTLWQGQASVGVGIAF